MTPIQKVDVFTSKPTIFLQPTSRSISPKKEVINTTSIHPLYYSSWKENIRVQQPSKEALIISLHREYHAFDEIAQPAIGTYNFPFAVAVTLDSEEKEWLDLVNQQIILNHSEFGFTLESLSHIIFLSTRQIRRRLKRLTGMTFSQYLKIVRLEKALALLENQEVKSIKHLAYKIGMKDVKYFSKQFKSYFKVLPSTYL